MESSGRVCCVKYLKALGNLNVHLIVEHFFFFCDECCLAFIDQDVVFLTN